MITLNLIAPKEKKELRLFFFYYLMKNSLGLILICIVGVAIILSITRTVLRHNFYEVVNQTSLVHKNINTFNQEISEINNLLKEVGKIQNQYVPWSNVLTHFSKLTPTNIQIHSLLIKSIVSDKKSSKDKNTKWEVIIQGQAKNRDDLLELKRNLENSEIFTNIKSPLANILQRQNVTFNLTAIINLSDIQKIITDLSKVQEKIITPALDKETILDKKTKNPILPVNNNKQIEILNTDIDT